MEHHHHPNAFATASTILGQRDVTKEYDNFPCEVEGTIPDWISGRIYKQSGGAFGGKIDFFDGLAHIASFNVENGRATFTNKYMRTKDYENFTKKGIRTWQATVLEPSKPSAMERISERLQKLFGMKKFLYNGFNPNVTCWVMDQGRTVAAVTEGDGEICAFDPKSLVTLPSKKTMHPVHRGGMIITNCAHYIREGDLGGFHAALEMAISWSPLSTGSLQPVFKFYYEIFLGDESPMKCVYKHEIASFLYGDRFKANEEFAKRPGYMYAMARSENYLVLLWSSHRLDFDRLLTGKMDKGFFGLFPHVEHPMEFIVLRTKASGTGSNVPTVEFVTRLSVDYVGHIWHIANCYELEDGKKIVIDASGTNMMKSRSNIRHYVIDLAANVATCAQLYPFPLLGNTSIASTEQYEFVNINYKYHMKKNSFIYCLRASGTGEFYEKTTSLAKLNKENNSSTLCFNDGYIIPSEPVFIATPGSTAEDDGVVVCMCLDTLTETSFLAIVDATTFSVVAKISSPLVCNFGLHTVFVPNRGLDKLRTKL